MDPITTALIAGVAKLAEPAVKDGYDALKALIIRKFGGTSNVAKATLEMEQKPASPARRQMLTEEIASAKVNADPEIAAAAAALLEKLNSLPGGHSHVQQVISGNQNIVTGTGDINFSGRPPR